MITDTLPLAEITKEALRVLYREIGVVNTIRFVNQFTTGYGDYTAERKILFSNMTLDDLLTEMSRSKQKPPRKKPE
ncbi:MAG: hypothetical protein DCC59_04845 [Chloroflexi bacterium]|nr:hypothetical protein [Chloroflexi bacterium CFX1]MCQ3953858.1 hypothetical protein [Chloroflexota bacterium]MDL1920379.1 hypothetical protein [Chloroflexi bacterium CFX5]RIK54218.1 MAG: hypothetical protein DCC59_04845 [Chloroflexota bacterium]